MSQYLLDEGEAKRLLEYFRGKCEHKLGKGKCLVELVWMPPMEFLSKVPHPLTTAIPASGDLERGWSKTLIEGLMEAVRKGSPLPPLFLDYTDMWYGYPTHEGRNRAYASLKMGIKEVPVIVTKERKEKGSEHVVVGRWGRRPILRSGGWFERS